MSNPFHVQEATREAILGRVILSGISGAGKTMTALELALVLADDDPNGVVVIDTEYRTARKYVGEPRIDVALGRLDQQVELRDYRFRVIDVDLQATPMSPRTLGYAMKAALDAGAKVIVVDSASHVWDWILTQVDDWRARNPRADQRRAWQDVGNPETDKLTAAIVRCPVHLIFTTRAKSEWVDTVVDGRRKPEKVGMAPRMRDGIEFEFDLSLRMEPKDGTVVAAVEKTRMGSAGFTPGRLFPAPGREVALAIREWLTKGERPVELDTEQGPVKAPDETPPPPDGAGDAPPAGPDDAGAGGSTGEGGSDAGGSAGPAASAPPAPAEKGDKPPARRGTTSRDTVGPDGLRKWERDALDSARNTRSSDFLRAIYENGSPPAKACADALADGWAREDAEKQAERDQAAEAEGKPRRNPDDDHADHAAKTAGPDGQMGMA